MRFKLFKDTFIVIAWFDGLLKRSTVNEILFLTTLQNSFHYK